MGTRLDVWLDVACLFKTRSEAQRACQGGKIEVNGQGTAKPHREVKPGDESGVGRIVDLHTKGKLPYTLRWQAELGGPQQLMRTFGWTPSLLKAGTKITMTGRRLKSGATTRPRPRSQLVL